jgi:hypothetical protein
MALLVLAVGCGDDDSDGKKQPDDKGNHQGDVGDGDANDDGKNDGDTGANHDNGDNGGDNGADGQLGKDLSEAEAEALCEELSAGVDVEWSKEQECTVGAVFYTKDKASCEAAAKKCAEAPDEVPAEDAGVDEGEDDTCKGAADDLKTCTATVDEIRTCIQAMTKNLQDLGTITCESAGKVSTSDLETPPPVCAPLQQKCPDLFSEEAEDDSLPTEGSSEGASLRRFGHLRTR